VPALPAWSLRDAILAPWTEVTRAAHEAMLERDWEGLCLMLHPYLHWTAPDGTRLRGRTKVMALLRAAS
jgi:hypothetical protein